MTKSEAIKCYCRDCAGDSPKEVALCHIVDCPLWPYRFGFSTRDKRYGVKMDSVRRRYPDEDEEVQRLIAEYREMPPICPKRAQRSVIFGEEILSK